MQRPKTIIEISRQEFIRGGETLRHSPSANDREQQQKNHSADPRDQKKITVEFTKGRA
ncbi:MAG: hypothetical protein HY043_14690 [Verrucomicrobia bacterium]|nr:hypothetical protein [Verrucomicrobiota bacterium]